MKTQDQPITRLVNWYLELEDRYEVMPGATDQAPIALQPHIEDGPICRPDNLNNTLAGTWFVDVMR